MMDQDRMRSKLAEIAMSLRHYLVETSDPDVAIALLHHINPHPVVMGLNGDKYQFFFNFAFQESYKAMARAAEEARLIDFCNHMESLQSDWKMLANMLENGMKAIRRYQITMKTKSDNQGDVTV